MCVFQILDSYELIDKAENRNFTMATQNNIIGGFSKWISTDVEPLHTYFGKFISTRLYICSKFISFGPLLIQMLLSL